MLSKEQIQRIRESTSFEQIVSPHVQRIIRSGSNLKALCCFHEDRNPSLSIDPVKKVFHCFGCGAKGDIFKFVMLAENVSFPEAVERVAAVAGIDIRHDAQETRPDSETEQRVGQVFKRFGKPKEYAIEQWMLYHNKLLKSSRAIEEFKSRGISIETLKRNLIGYSETGEKLVRPDGDLIDWRNKPWIGFSYIWAGKIRLIKWRVIFSEGKKFLRACGMAETLYVSGTPDPLEEVFLTEGEMDALSLRQAGFFAASLPSGFQSRLTAEMREYLLGFRKVYLCLDNDDEGRFCLRRLLTELPNDRTGVITIPEKHKDANGLLVEACDRNTEQFRREIDSLVAKADRPSSVSFCALDQAFDIYLEKSAARGAEPFFQMPWPNVDCMAVIKPGQLVSVMTSRSGLGKTTWTIQACIHNALKLNRKIGYYTAEMDMVEELIPMITSQLLSRDRNNLRRADVEESKRICAGADFYFGYDPEANGWKEVSQLLEIAVQRLGLDVVVIDHLDFLIRDPDWKRENAEKGVAVRWLKEELARKYGVLAIVLRQSVKQDQKARQRGDVPADIYDALGPVAGVTDADHVFILHRNKFSNPTEEEGRDIYENRTRVILGKTRQKGAGASLSSLTFLGKFAKFEMVSC